jgi:hypothetical protein
VRYWLEDGLWTTAVCYRIEGRLGYLIVNLNTVNGYTVIGKPDWFDLDYAMHWNKLVPECAEEGTAPGEWSRKPAEKGGGAGAG